MKNFMKYFGDFWVLVRKCCLSFVIGVFWLVFLFKEGFGDTGSEYNMTVCFFLSLGTCSFFVTFALLNGIIPDRSFSFYSSVSVISYLLVGLIVNIVIRREWGDGFLPEFFEKDGKVYF